MRIIWPHENEASAIQHLDMTVDPVTHFPSFDEKNLIIIMGMREIGYTSRKRFSGKAEMLVGPKIGFDRKLLDFQTLRPFLSAAINS